jgi:hypothetical protein
LLPSYSQLLLALFAAILCVASGSVGAQVAVPENWLRLEGYSQAQRQALRRDQEALRRSVEPLAPAQRRKLEQRFLQERLEQRGLQTHQRARESDDRARSNRRPVPETRVDQSRRNQQYRVEQQRFRLQQQIERRSSTYGGVRPTPPRPRVDVGP